MKKLCPFLTVRIKYRFSRTSIVINKCINTCVLGEFIGKFVDYINIHDEIEHKNDFNKYIQ